MSRSYRWFVVFLLWLVCFLNYADRQVIFVDFPLLRREFALNNFALGALSASFMGMYALTGPFAGWVGDRVKRSSLIVAALVLWSAATAASSLAHGFWPLLLGIAVTGASEAFYFPAAMSLISDYHPSASRSRAMALHQSGVYVGSIVGGWLAGLLGEHTGWRVGSRMFGLAGVVMGVLMCLLLREPSRGESDETAGPVSSDGSVWQALRELMANRTARLLVLVFIGANFVAMVFTVWMPTYLFGRFHMTLGLAGLNATAYMQAASIAGCGAGRRGGRCRRAARGRIGANAGAGDGPAVRDAVSALQRMGSAGGPGAGSDGGLRAGQGRV